MAREEACPSVMVCVSAASAAECSDAGRSRHAQWLERDTPSTRQVTATGSASSARSRTGGGILGVGSDSRVEWALARSRTSMSTACTCVHRGEHHCCRRAGGPGGAGRTHGGPEVSGDPAQRLLTQPRQFHDALTELRRVGSGHHGDPSPGDVTTSGRCPEEGGRASAEGPGAESTRRRQVPRIQASIRLRRTSSVVPTVSSSHCAGRTVGGPHRGAVTDRVVDRIEPCPSVDLSEVGTRAAGQRDYPLEGASAG